jgi:hypothetical protein
MKCWPMSVVVIHVIFGRLPDVCFTLDSDQKAGAP